MNNDSSDKNKASNPKSWKWTSTELQRALNEWDDLASQSHKLSPDEKMLVEMQRLLGELKQMLDELSK